jgi:hypothetical protein
MVLAIWTFEKLANSRDRDGNVTSFNGPQTPTTSKRHPRLPVNAPRLLMADVSNAPGRMHHTSRSHTQAGSAESDVQLKTLVFKLSTQLEELTAVVSQLQQQREANMSAA